MGGGGGLGDFRGNSGFGQQAYDNLTGKHGRSAQITSVLTGGLANTSALGGPNSVGNRLSRSEDQDTNPHSFVNDPLGTNNPDKPPDAPPPDPTLESVKAAQVADAKSYRQNLGQTQNSMYEQAYKGERQNLAQNLQTTRENANSRGLLNSGLEQGNELGQRANSNANLAQTRSEINNSTESQARQLEANAVQTGIMQQQSLANIQDQTMSQALAQMAARRQVISGVAQGVGSGVGTYLAGQNSNNYGLNQPTRYAT